MDAKFYPTSARNWDDSLFRDRIIMKLTPESTVLDLGAGAGIVSQMDFRGHAARICGVDLDSRVEQNPFLDEGRVADGQAIPYPDASFDLVFADNVLEHLADPVSVFLEVSRVLKPGGVFAASNWMIAHDGEPSPQMKAYVAAEGLSFAMASPARYAEAMRRAGFTDITVRDRNPWYREVAREELARLKGPLYAQAAAAVGVAYVDKNIKTWEAMQKVLDSGEHRPTHLRGWRPVG